VSSPFVFTYREECPADDLTVTASGLSSKRATPCDSHPRDATTERTWDQPDGSPLPMQMGTQTATKVRAETADADPRRIAYQIVPDAPHPDQ
jgi:hypothetical protein